MELLCCAGQSVPWDWDCWECCLLVAFNPSPLFVHLYSFFHVVACILPLPFYLLAPIFDPPPRHTGGALFADSLGDVSFDLPG